MNENFASRFIRSYAAEAALVCTLIGLAFLFTQSHFGYSTRILNLGDEGLLWYVSQRTALGEVPLRDFFSYDPGRYYWSAFIFKLLRGDGLFEQIVAADLFGVMGLFLTYIIMMRLGIDRKWRIATALLLGVALGFPRHKIFEQTLSLIAVAGVTFVLSKPTVKRWFYYGLATGLAAFFGRNSGLYFVVAAILLFAFLKYLGVTVSLGRAFGAYVLGGTIGYLPMFVMVLGVHGFASALWRSVLLNSKQLIPIPVPFPWRLHAMGLHGVQPVAVSILFIVAPVTYVLLILLFPRLEPGGELSGERRLAYGASLAGLPYLFHAFSYASFGHLAQAVLPFVVATAALSAYLARIGKLGLSLSVLFSLTGLVLACWLPREPAIEYLRKRDRYKPIEIQNTRFEMISEDADLLSAAQVAFQRCGPRDGSLLASPDHPAVYAFLKTRSPFWEVYFIFLRLPRSEESQTRHIEALIENQTALVLLRPEDQRGMAVLYPRLLDYIETHYQPMKPALPIGDMKMYDLPQVCGE